MNRASASDFAERRSSAHNVRVVFLHPGLGGRHSGGYRLGHRRTVKFTDILVGKVIGKWSPGSLQLTFLDFPYYVWRGWSSGSSKRPIR